MSVVYSELISYFACFNNGVDSDGDERILYGGQLENEPRDGRRGSQARSAGQITDQSLFNIYNCIHFKIR